MVRSPCCEKMGMKKGPWTPEEDQILISHIQRYGHANWRALPKEAGLLRCGKSCRLRWINYLRPDIKRGKFTKEEVATIIELHRILGNRWSTIAARLPGRTDNEIKNFWHTHLKKHERLSKVHTTISTSPYPLQETQETSSSVDDASGATSSVTGKLLIANEYDSLSSRRNPPTIGMGFYGTVSCDISEESETMGSNNTHNEMGEEIEFWYQLLISSYHMGMEI